LAHDDNGEYGFFGSFHEVRENERIVQTFTFEGFPDAVNLETMTLTDLGDGRTRLHSTAVFDSVESRDGRGASGRQPGGVEGDNQRERGLAGAETADEARGRPGAGGARAPADGSPVERARWGRARRQ